MHANPYNALGQYRNTDAWGATSGDRIQLILHMMDGVLDRIALARGHMRRKEVSAKGEAIGRAIRLIDGLRAALDRQQGGGLADNLEQLYDYMARRLAEANLRNDEKPLDEVARLMDELRDGWGQLAQTGNPAAATGATSLRA